MADFFDKMLVGINKGVNTVSVGSKVLVEKAKLNTQIKDTEWEKNRLFQNIGTLVYNLHINGEVEIEQCAEMYSEVAAIDQKIEMLQRQLQALESPQTQPTRYAQTIQPNTAANGVSCKCGFINKEGAKFCAKCGSALSADENMNNQPVKDVNPED